MKAPLSIASMVAGLVVGSAGLMAQQPRFVYTNDDVIGANTVSIFSVAADGSLSPVGSPVPTGDGGTGGGSYAANRITISGNLLFAANGGSGSVSAFSIDATSGFLTSAGAPLATGAAWGDMSLAASPKGQFLFAGLSANHTISIMNVGVGGALSASGLSATLPA